MGRNSRDRVLAEIREPERALDDSQRLLLDFLCGDKTHGDTLEAFVKSTGIPKTSVYRWKKRHPGFTRAWHARMIDSAAHPQFLQAQLEHLRNMAADGDRESDRIKAIELYWKLVDRMSPTVLAVTTAEQDVAALTDADLDEMEARADAADRTARGLPTHDAQVDHLRALQSGSDVVDAELV